ncbi:MAG: sigma-70 family RNA polymerase sigma factor [Flavobacterium sp.]
MEDKVSDIYLWSQIKNGEALAYHKLYDCYADALFSFGIQYTNDDFLVQDAIHDVFVELHHYRKSIAEKVAIKAYLFKSLQRNIFKKLKAQSKTVGLDFVSESFYKTDSMEDDFIFTETNLTKSTNLALALTSLTEKQRYALHLRFSEDQSYEEISSTFNISIESCRTLIYRALKEIRNKF